MHLSGFTPRLDGKAAFSMPNALNGRPLSSSSLAASNLNYAWACSLVESFAGLGGKQAVVCPGSRNTPLLLAFAEHPGLEALSVLDERSAAFFALGLAKRSRQPVALVCTSGTAVANFYPAVIEAYKFHVPLLMLTADRPGAVRYCSARQTVNQLDVFGRFTRFCAELALPEAKPEAFAYLRQTCLQAYEKALAPDSGPVHLNVPFDEPLDPKLDTSFQTLWPKIQASSALVSVLPPLVSEPFLDASVLEPIFKTLFSTQKGLIILGSWQDEIDVEGFSESLSSLSSVLSWPIVADVTSSSRYLKSPLETIVSTYDFLLADADLAASLKPDIVLQIGPLPNSRKLNDYLAGLDIPSYIVTPYGDNLDPHHRNTQHFRVSLKHFVKALENYFKDASPSLTQTESSFLKLWKQADTFAQNILKTKLEAESTVFDGKVVYELAQVLPAKTQVILANSRTVRNAEQFFFVSDKAYKVFFNGGVNGSDGIMSTALGIAHGSDVPTVLLIGDLAFLHDSNALLLSQTFRGSLTVVIVNNNGGGIFHQLPIAQYAETKKTFEKYIATPQTVNIADLAKAHGLSHQEIQCWEDLRSISFGQPGIHLIEIKTHRSHDANYHSKLFRACSEQLRTFMEDR